MLTVALAVSACERMHFIAPSLSYVQHINKDLFDQPSTNSVEKFCSLCGDRRGGFWGSGELPVQTGMRWEPEGARVKGNFMRESTSWCMATNPTQRLHPGRARARTLLTRALYSVKLSVTSAGKAQCPPHLFLDLSHRGV